MAKIEQVFSPLKQLYAKRETLSKQIIDAEKKLTAEINKPAPAIKAAKKVSPKSPAAKQTVKK